MEKDINKHQAKITKLENNVLNLSDQLLKEKICNHDLEKNIQSISNKFKELDSNL